MGFDLRDIAELIPFIKDNLVNSVFILLVGMFLGFSIGIFISKLDSKSKRNLKRKNQELTDEIQSLRNKAVDIPKDSTPQSSFIPLVDFKQLLNSEFLTAKITTQQEIILQKGNEEGKK